MFLFRSKLRLWCIKLNVKLGGWCELCTLSSAHPLVKIVFLVENLKMYHSDIWALESVVVLGIA